MRFLLVRHAEATGQEPTAPLTERGEAQALALRDVLLGLGITAVVSSPYRRALATVAPFADAARLEVWTDARLVELRLAGAPRASWREDLRLAFEEPERVLEGGESVGAARARALAAARDAVQASAGLVAVCTHGALAAILLGAFDPGLGFEAWAAMGTPALFEVQGGRISGVPLPTVP